MIRCVDCRGKGRVLGNYNWITKTNPEIECPRCKGMGKEPSRADCRKRKICDTIGRAVGALEQKKCGNFADWNLAVYYPGVHHDLKEIDGIIERVQEQLRAADPGLQLVRAVKRGRRVKA